MIKRGGILSASGLFAASATLGSALLLGDRLETAQYGGVALILAPASFLFGLALTERHSRAENERLQAFGAAVAEAPSQTAIDEALLGEARRLVPADCDAAIVQLDPRQDRAVPRSGILRRTQSAEQLRFERQTDGLVELRDILFVRLCGGERPLFLFIAKNGRRTGLFRAHNRLRALCALARTAYEKQFLIDGLALEIEDALRSRPEASARLARLDFGLAERERGRLALELHDTALQDQLFWRRQLAEAIERSGDRLPAELTERLDRISDGMLDVVDRIREICGDLKPDLGGHDLSGNDIDGSITTGASIRANGPGAAEGASLTDLADRAGQANDLTRSGARGESRTPEATAERVFGELLRRARLRCDFALVFDASSFPYSLGREEWLILYRIVQELLNNAARHSRAGRVELTLDADGDLARLRYADDGVGAAPAKAEHPIRAAAPRPVRTAGTPAAESPEQAGGMGLAGIRERARALSGTVSFATAPGAGFRCEVRFRPRPADRDLGP